MPALLSIEGCVVLCRMTDPPRGPAYREHSPTHDPCVWIRDARANGRQNLWHCFYADEVIAFMQDLSTIDFSPNVIEDRVGVVTFSRENVYSLSMKGLTVSPDPNYQLDWEISLDSSWETFPFRAVAGIIERHRSSLRREVMLPVHPNDAAGAHKLLEYFETHRNKSDRPPHMFLPITILRPEVS